MSMEKIDERENANNEFASGWDELAKVPFAGEMQEIASEPIHIDLKTEEFDKRFDTAEQYVKVAPVVVEEVTAEGLMSGLYADKGVRQNSNGDYVLECIVVNTKQDTLGNISRVPEVETAYTLEPGMFIVTNPVFHEGDPRNHFVQKSREKVDKLYENAAEDDDLGGFSFGDQVPRGTIMRPKGFSAGEISPRKVINNETGNDVRINDPWGGEQIGAFDCHFIENGDRNNRCIISNNDFEGYVPYDEYKAEK